MRRARRDSGVTIVEAAFVLPLLFTFVFGLVDLGMWTFNSNKAANAARDGARAGILSYELADADPSDPDHADRDTIVAAVRAHLTNETVDDSDITITCERGDTTIACADAVIDEDHIRVQVEWGWDLVTPIAGLIGVETGTARGSATMAIVGKPLSGNADLDPEPEDPAPTDPPPADPADPPATCGVTHLTTTPNSVSSKGNQLEQDLRIEFTTTNSAACTSLRIELDGTKNNPTTLEYACGCGEGPDDFTWTYRGSNNIWQPGTGTVRILNGNTVLRTTTFFVS